MHQKVRQSQPQQVNKIQWENAKGTADPESLQLMRHRFFHGFFFPENTGDQVTGEYKKKLNAKPAKMQKTTVKGQYQQDGQTPHPIETFYVALLLHVFSNSSL